MKQLPVELGGETLAELAARWKIEELAVFGSVTRDDFDGDSDIDLLVTFAPDAHWTLWDFFDLEEHLERLLGHPVDLVEKRALRNPYRRQHILSTAQVVYAA